MKKLIIVASALVLFSCKSPQKVLVSNSEEEDFVLAYKKCVLYGCINDATNNKFNLFSKENNDLGLAVEVAIMQHAEVSIAIEKGKQLSKNIKSIDYADYEGRKPIYTSCVSFAFSKEIDSIARVIFKNK
jgi:hypothetical protein